MLHLSLPMTPFLQFLVYVAVSDWAVFSFGTGYLVVAIMIGFAEFSLGPSWYLYARKTTATVASIEEKIDHMKKEKGESLWISKSRMQLQVVQMERAPLGLEARPDRW